MDSHVDSKPVSLIARVVALWTNKRFLSAVNSHLGFQIEKFGTRLAAVIAIVIFLYIRMDLVDFGHVGKFWKTWKSENGNDDDDDDDDARNEYLRNEYL